MSDDDGPRLSPEDQQKLAAIGAALDREAGGVPELAATGTKLTPGGQHRWLIPAAAGVGVVVLVLAGAFAWKAARGPFPPTPTARRSLPVDAPASSGRSRIASRTEALPAGGAPLLDRTGGVARSESQTAPEIPVSPAPTVAPTTSVSALRSDTEKLEDRLTRLETETARLRGVVQDLSERVRTTKAREKDGKTTAQKVQAERSRQQESRPRAADASVARAVGRPAPLPVWIGPLPSVAKPEGGSQPQNDASGAEGGDVVSASPSVASAGTGAAVEPEVRPSATVDTGRSDPPAISGTVRAEDAAPVVGGSDVRAAHGPSPSKEWARIKKETGQFAEDAKAAGRRIADGFRRLGKTIKEAVGAD